jgi:hypothetical protein
VFVAAVAALLAAPRGAPADSFDGSTTDAWDIAQGTIVTGHSGIIAGSDIEDLFGGATSSVEPRSVIFADGLAPGTVHFVEWRTAAPVPVDGFILRANDDGPVSKNRGFSEFRLFARNTGTGEFEQVSSYSTRNPYGEQITVMDTFAQVTAQEFRAEFVQAANPANGGPRVREIDAPPPRASIDGAVLGQKGRVKIVGANPSASLFTVSGVIDAGSATPAFGTPADISIAGLAVSGAALTSRRGTFTFASGGFSGRITPSPVGSSRTPFSFMYRGDVTGQITSDGEVPLGYADADVDVGGRIRLERSKYGIFGLGSLRAPSFALLGAKGRLLGGGGDSLTLAFAVFRVESIPTNPIDVRLTIGDDVTIGIPRTAFRRRGDNFVLARPTGAVRKATLDFNRGTFTFALAGIDLSSVAPAEDGTAVVRLGAEFGPDRRDVTVRLGRKGSKFQY